jgi:hypothetical protein
MLYEGLAKTNFFDLVWFDTVLADVFETISRPYELIDCHALILGKPQARYN